MVNCMSPEAFAEKMREISMMSDIEDAHITADDLMEDILVAFGYEEGVQIYHEMEKWYAQRRM